MWTSFPSHTRTVYIPLVYKFCFQKSQTVWQRKSGISLKGSIWLCGCDCNPVNILTGRRGQLLFTELFYVLFFIAYSDYYHLDQKSMTGIVVGVSIALTCILICILILIYRSKARYVFALEGWALSPGTDSWDVPSSPRVLSSLKYSVSSPVPTSCGNKALCWLFLLYLSPFSNEKEEEPTEWVSGALTTKYEACFQIEKTLFVSDKHAALHHLLFLLNPPACPGLVCEAVIL